MKIGQANYDRGGSKKIEKIKDGDNIYRIIPPVGTYADKGRWNRYMKVEWGYKDTQGNNRPFQDCRRVNSKTKMIEVESACHLKREDLKAKYAKVQEIYRAGGCTKDQLEAMKAEVDRYNLEKRYYVNAINVKNEIVLLKIGYKAMQTLESEIKKLRDKGVDPLSVNNGRFFNIFRTGNGFDTLYTVSVVDENIDVPGIGLVKKEKVHVLDDAMISRFANECTDLGTLDKLYPVVSAEQTERIVNGGPEVLEEILGKKETTSSVGSEVEKDPEEESAYVAQKAPVTPPVQAPPQVQAPITPPVSTPKTNQTQSQADFMKSLGL